MVNSSAGLTRSLVQRVSLAICYAEQRNETGSRAAIREVAAWLMDEGFWQARGVLIEEVDQCAVMDLDEDDDDHPSLTAQERNPTLR